MKDLYKNPILYYVLVPVLVALWPLLVWSRYLPAAQKNLVKWKDYCPDVNTVVGEILRLDPERLSDGSPQVTDRFDYTTAISRAAVKCGIPSGSYSHSTGMISKSSRGQQSQTGTITLKDVGVVQACKFLSMIQLDWPHLECTAVHLTQDKTTPDRWTVKLEFTYFF